MYACICILVPWTKQTQDQSLASTRCATADGPRDASSVEILSTAAQLQEQALQQIDETELEHYGRRTCSKQPRRVDGRKCRQQARPRVFLTTYDRLVVTKFYKSRVWDKVPEESTCTPIS